MSSLTPSELVAHNLRRLRLSAGISQEDLAARAGIHRTYVSSLEQGRRNIGVATVFALSKALGCDPREILAPLSETSEGR